MFNMFSVVQELHPFILWQARIGVKAMLSLIQLTTVGSVPASQYLALQVSIHCIISMLKVLVVSKDNLKKALMELQ